MPRRCPVRHDRHLHGVRRPAPSSTSTTGCGSCSRTSSRTSSISIDRRAGRASRATIFGRTPYAFPNLFLPLWQVEGLATYEESAITGEGRLHAGDFRAIVDEAAQASALEPHRSGQRRPDRLAGRPGHLRLRRRLPPVPRRSIRRRVAGGARQGDRRPRPVPGRAAFKQVYGESLGDLWRDYEAEPDGGCRSPSDRIRRSRG